MPVSRLHLLSRFTSATRSVLQKLNVCAGHEPFQLLVSTLIIKMQHSKSLTMLLQILFFLATVALAAPRPWVVTPDITSLDKRQSSSYWLETIQRQGSAAYNPDKSYKVFRNVKDYGAKGDGSTDDTDAINRAISDGNRCGSKGGDTCDSSTITPAIVYFPAGTYKISSSIVMLYYTQMIGDGSNLPRLQAASNFDASKNLALLDADPYIPNGNGAGFYTNQNNFYRQIRNLIVDLTQAPEAGPNGENVNGVHWQVAQACSMQNVVFEMKPDSATNKQRGIMMENGSGMFMSDIIFRGGATGAFLGSQQFLVRNLTFDGCNTAIALHWDWLWNFKSLNIQNCQVGINMSSTNPGNETVGSAIIMDSKISASKAAIITSYNVAKPVPETGSTLLIHNVDFAGSQVAVQGLSGNTVLAGNVKIASWGQGNVYVPSGNSAPAKREPEPQGGAFGWEDVVEDADATCSAGNIVTVTVTAAPVMSTSTVVVSPIPSTGSILFSTASGSVSQRPSFTISGSSSFITSTSRPVSSTSRGGNSTTSTTPRSCSAAVIPTKSRVLQQNMNAAPLPSVLLTADGSVFERGKPQYINVPKEKFISVKTFGATGDGVTDDSDAVQKAMTSVTTDQILYFDHGAYVITKTIQVPANIRIVGEIWPLMMISGTFFSDPNNPKPAFRIGQPGDTGNVEISDMMFETKGPAPGAIMMEWNVQEASQGSVGMWDTHFRVGGSAGTELQQQQCDSRTSKSFRPECAGSFLMMHITQSASAYFENTWFWVADHDLDLPEKRAANDTQVSLFNGRGLLIESQGPVWLWGTSSEHSVLYNYQLSNAKNVFMASVQTETAYMQPAPNALNSGFTPNPAFNDPDFADCTDDNCKKTWGLRILESEDIYMFGGGLYSFFEDYNQDCTIDDTCQLNMVDLQCSSNVYLYGLATKAAINQITVDGKPAVLDVDNKNNFAATVLLYQQD